MNFEISSKFLNWENREESSFIFYFKAPVFITIKYYNFPWLPSGRSCCPGIGPCRQLIFHFFSISDSRNSYNSVWKNFSVSKYLLICLTLSFLLEFLRGESMIGRAPLLAKETIQRIQLISYHLPNRNSHNFYFKFSSFFLFFRAKLFYDSHNP